MENKNSDIFKKQREMLPQAISDSLKIMGSEAVTFFVGAFNNQKFDNDSEMWAERKNNKDPGRNILMKTGTLRASIKAEPPTLDSVTISTGGLDYARILNEGGVNGTGGHIPARKFIGNSKELFEIIQKKIDKRIKQIFGKIN